MAPVRKSSDVRGLGIRPALLKGLGGCLIAAVAVLITGAILLVVSILWAERQRVQDDSKSSIAGLLPPISGRTPIDVRNAVVYRHGIPAMYTSFFELAPLADGQIATAAGVELRLKSNGYIVATGQSRQSHTYQRVDSASINPASNAADPPKWWPAYEKGVIEFSYGPAPVILSILTDGRIFGSEFIPD